MGINKEKLIRFFLAFLLFVLLLTQLGKSKELFEEKELLQIKISDQQEQNGFLVDEYSFYTSNKNSAVKKQVFDLKESTAQILAELKSFNLKLIDFSSAENELNLNIKGDFYSILNFIHYLENEMKALNIEEFKIKNENDELFFFLKLKNELI